MATEEQLSELLVQCCSLGDPQTLQQVVNEYPNADFNMTTEGGVTLLMHAVIGAGQLLQLVLQTIDIFVR